MNHKFVRTILLTASLWLSQSSSFAQTSGAAFFACEITGNTGVPGAGCRKCVISSAGTVCDKDANFRSTGQLPRVPTDATVTAAYMNSTPIPVNLRGYGITLSHEGKSALLAVQAEGVAPVYATANDPVKNFNGQSLLTGTWQVSLNPSHFLGQGWSLYYEYILAWRSGGGGTATAPVPTPVAARLGGIPSVQRIGLETFLYIRSYPDAHLLEFYRPNDDAAWRISDLSLSTDPPTAIRYGSLAVTAGSRDSIDVFAMTTGEDLVNFSKRPSSRWTATQLPAPRGQKSSDNPSAVLDRNGTNHVFVTAGSYNLWEWTQRPGGPWQVNGISYRVGIPGYQLPVPALGFGTPFSFEDASGVHVVVQNNRWALTDLTKRADGMWDIRTLPAIAVSRPDRELSGVSNYARTDMAVRRNDGRVYLFTKPNNSSATGWSVRDTGAIMTGVPALAADSWITYIAGYQPSGTVGLVRGQQGNFVQASGLNQPISGDPAIVQDPSGTTYIFTVSPQGALVELRGTAADRWSTLPHVIP